MDTVADDPLDLWRSFRQSGDPLLREQLIAGHLELARMHAAKLYGGRQVRGVEFEEFHQYALTGLIEAVDRFDPERGVAFAAYAGHRIRGAVLNGIALYSEQQQQISARARMREERFQQLLEEVAAAEQDPFLHLVEMAVGTAIGYMLEDSAMYQEEGGAYEHNIYRSRELQDLARVLDGLLHTLPAVEQQVMRLHYFQQVRFDEIARSMGLTKGRISQIHHQALGRMRQHYDQLQLLRTDY